MSYAVHDALLRLYRYPLFVNVMPFVFALVVDDPSFFGGVVPVDVEMIVVSATSHRQFPATS